MILSEFGHRPQLDIQDPQRVFHLSHLFCCLYIPTIDKQTSALQISSIKVPLNTPAMSYTQMRQMQMLLFAHFGVCPSQSVARPGLAKLSHCGRVEMAEYRRKSILLPAQTILYALTLCKYASNIDGELVLVVLVFMCLARPRFRAGLRK